MVTQKNETEDLLLSKTKNCKTLITQTHGKGKETLEFKLTEPREILHFNPPIQIEGSSMIGINSLKVYKFIFNINTINKKFELYTDDFDVFPLKI